MRMLMLARLPHKTFNAAVKDGTADAKVRGILEEIRPEAVYYTEISGQRTILMIVELKEASAVPALAEPWFLTFDADVEFHIVMGQDDIKQAGLAALGKKWG